MRFVKVLITLFFVGMIVVGCAPSDQDSTGATGDEPKMLSVYTSLYPFQYAVEQIGGDTVAVETVYPPGADAHTYEPTSRDMTAIAESDAFIYLGAGMEGFAESAADALANQDVKLIEIGAHEELFHGHGAHEHDDHGHADGGNEHGKDGHENEEHRHEHGEGAHEHVDHAHEHEDEAHEHAESAPSNESASASAIILEGLSAHYHTGDAVELTAVIKEESEHEHWHWYTLDPGEEEWTTVADQGTNSYTGEATTNGQQIKAALFGDDHEVIAESEPVTIAIDDHTGDHDPHIWIDPLRMIEISEIIKDELIVLNPDEEATYTKNFEALKEELLALDGRYTELLETKKNKHIIVPHAAFGYWEERYGVEQIAVSGLSSSQEPSQKELTEVVDQAGEHNLDYILYEQNSTNRLSEVIQEQIGAKALTIHNLSVLTEEDIKNNEDYISLMDYNLEILDQATK